LQWMKQVFAQRYNGMEGRIGHVWGDRYGSRILEGEPAEGAEVGDAVESEFGNRDRDRPRRRKCSRSPCFPFTFPFPPDPAPG
jgi:hypothetical protein